jgi:geranylgeranyl transferase type-2 subunit beta
MSYLARLMLRLSAGAAKLPEPLRDRHAGYVAAAQQDDGGFAGRRGRSDPYYTSFALRTLAVLGRLEPGVTGRATAFLQSRLDEKLAPADFLALVGGALLIEGLTGEDVFARAGHDRLEDVVRLAEQLGRDDGGYAKTERSGPSSSYQTFLVAATKELVGAPRDDAVPIVEMLRSRRRDDGGFVELPVVRESGTNPTAAAMGLLRILERADDPMARGVAAFLAAMQTPEGGFRANTRIPVADLLSTFTALATLADLGAFESVDTAAAARYVASLEVPEGGFRGGPWDDAPDVEYTFYGIGSLAVLAAGEG